MPKTAVLIDGGHVRVRATRAGRRYDVPFIEKLGHACRAADERLLRILYYDCAPFNGTVTLPVSGGQHVFKGSDQWLDQLARADLFAVRRGVLKFRGWVLRRIPHLPSPLTDADFRPQFEQKGVDMRIGLDMADFAANRCVDRLAIVSNDTDCVPAMKRARRGGLQIVLVCLPGPSSAPELLAHCDFKRDIAWP